MDIDRAYVDPETQDFGAMRAFHKIIIRKVPRGTLTAG